jgi:nucleoside-diphosphate-sugar epimerase
MRIFVAGATGAIGRPLVRQLIAAGHTVTGMTRTPEKTGWLLERGAAAVVVNALDTETMKAAVRQAEVGAKRHIMQCVAFMYAPSGHIHSEDDPMYLDAPPPWDTAIPPFPQIEKRVVDEPALEGIVLRYGFFYGPGTHLAPDGSQYSDVKKRRYPIVGDGGGVYSFIHVDDAAAAIVLAAEEGQHGIYNVVDNTPVPVRKWLPAYAEALGAKSPQVESVLLALPSSNQLRKWRTL